MTWLLAPLAIWGAIDMYMCYRFIRKPEVDWSAGVLWWHTSKWSFASQMKHFVKAFPYVSQDLTEALNIRPDDGETT